MAITITRDLNVVSVGVPPVIHLSQYDSDFTLVFNLYASTGTFTVPTGTTAEIRGTKRDGNGYDADATVSGTTVTVTGNEQMTAIAGANIYEIALYKNSKQLFTSNFILAVEPSALDANTITSESVLKELNAIIESASIATEAAAEATEAAEALTTAIPVNDQVKTALLACFEHVAWIGDNGQDYYDALEASLQELGYPKITATFTPGTHVVYTDDTLSSLTPYLVVKYFEDASDTGTVISSNDYTLSGSLIEGNDTIYVSYENYSATFIVTVVPAKYVYSVNGTTEWTDKNNISGIKNPQNLVLVSGYSIKGNNDSVCAQPHTTAGRCTSLTQVITGISDGQTVSLSRYSLTSGVSVSYALWYGYIDNNNSFNGTQYISLTSSFIAMAWLQASVILPTDANKTGDRFLMIAFRKGDGSSGDFTEAELQELPTLITIV